MHFPQVSQALQWLKRMDIINQLWEYVSVSNLIVEHGLDDVWMLALVLRRVHAYCSTICSWWPETEEIVSCHRECCSEQ